MPLESEGVCTFFLLNVSYLIRYHLTFLYHSDLSCHLLRLTITTSLTIKAPCPSHQSNTQQGLDYILLLCCFRATPSNVQELLLVLLKGPW